MIHSAPTIDLMGLIQVHSLEVGTLNLNNQTVPGVRLRIQQQPGRDYPILASGQVAGEIYAYCAAALEFQVEEIDGQIHGMLILDAQQRLHILGTAVSWFTSSAFRERATAKILRILQGGDPAGFTRCAEPFAVVHSGG